MNDALVDQTVRAVLYEGYLLYPYRPSAVKNRQRFNFGVLYPPAYTDAHGGEDGPTMQTECLVLGNVETECMVRVKFLRMVDRSILKPGVVHETLTEALGNEFEPVERLEINGRTYQPWQEAVEETIEVPGFNLSAIVGRSIEWPFNLSARQEREAIPDERGVPAGVILREKRSISGAIGIWVENLERGGFKLTVRIANHSRVEEVVIKREAALKHSLVSTHTVLGVTAGEFISSIDPPEAYCKEARDCKNIGTWPILVGAEGERDTMLSSPIILYDYPEIAPESPGDLFDGAEIDEILSLRILSMTDEEKREMRESDGRARQILERTEALPEEQWKKLHGAMRGLRTRRRKHCE